jgi:hypothetical protein
MIIASGDTTTPDAITGRQSPVSHPIFMRQNAGLGLTGNDCAATVSTPVVAHPKPASGGSKPPTNVLGQRRTLANTGTESGTAAGVAALVTALGLAWRIKRLSVR